jgi:hypothetical protein
MKGKIIQFVRDNGYEAVLTDKGEIYERNFIHKPATDIAPGAYRYEWTKWVKKEITIIK